MLVSFFVQSKFPLMTKGVVTLYSIVFMYELDCMKVNFSNAPKEFGIVEKREIIAQLLQML